MKLLQSCDRHYDRITIMGNTESNHSKNDFREKNMNQSDSIMSIDCINHRDDSTEPV